MSLLLNNCLNNSATVVPVIIRSLDMLLYYIQATYRDTGGSRQDLHVSVRCLGPGTTNVNFMLFLVCFSTNGNLIKSA